MTEALAILLASLPGIAALVAGTVRWRAWRAAGRVPLPMRLGLLLFVALAIGGCHTTHRGHWATAPVPQSKLAFQEPVRFSDGTEVPAQNGLLASYFAGAKYDRLDHQQIDPQVDFFWDAIHGGPVTTPDATDTNEFWGGFIGLPPRWHHWAVVWEGYLEAAVEGDYVLGVHVNNGGWIEMKGATGALQVVVSAPGGPSFEGTVTARRTLTAGRHYIRFSFYQNSPPIGVARLLWQPPGQAGLSVIPSVVLFTQATPPLDPELEELMNECVIADPVRTASLTYTGSWTDVSVPGLAGGLVFTRTYNSTDTKTGPFGLGWTHSYHSRLVQAGTAVSVFRPSGRFATFARESDGSYRAPLATHDVLRELPDGTFLLQTKDHTSWTYSGEGHLLSVADRNGQAVSLAYDAEGRLVSVREPTGRQVQLVYNADGRVVALVDPEGRTTTYSYDPQQQLSTVVQPGGPVWQYSYDAVGRLAEVVDPDGIVRTRNTYDARGRVVTQEEAGGNRFAFSAAPGVMTVSDAAGLTVTDRYDPDGNIESRTRSGGGVSSTIQFRYDANGKRIATVDPNGRETTFTYDSRGNVLTRTDPLGRIWQYEYDSRDNLTRSIDPVGAALGLSYDESDNVVAIEQEAKAGVFARTAFVYDERGLITSITNALGRVSTFTYDAHGSLASVADPLGRATAFRYDVLGRLVESVDPRGVRTTFSYDAAGRLTRSVEDADGLAATREFAYDGRGNRTSATDPNGHTTEFAYDAGGRLARVVDALGRATAFAYDVHGNRTSVTDASGATSSFAYDALDRLVRTTDALGASEEFSYDTAGNLVAAADKLGRETRYSYDAADRLVTMTDPAGGSVTFAYDGADRRTAITAPNGGTATFAYDLAGRRVEERDALGNAWRWSYDVAGNRIQQVDPNGQLTQFVYDPADQLVGIEYADGATVRFAYDPSGQRTAMEDPTGTTAAAYDALGRLTSIAQPVLGAVAYDYDATGNRTRLVLPGGRATTYEYDAADQLTAVTDAAGRTTSYEYDARGLPGATTLPNGVATERAYDAAGRLLSLVHRRGSTELGSVRYTLDAVGNRLAIEERFAGARSPALGAAVERKVAYAYDALDRLLSAAYSDGSPAERYTYDAAGNRLSATLGGRTVTYAYDAADRLLRAGDGVAEHDANGNLVRLGTRTYQYDAADRLLEANVGPGLSDRARYTYNGDGVRVAREARGHTTRWLQDLATALPVVLREHAPVQGGVPSSIDFTWGLELVSQEGSGGDREWRALLADGLGSVRSLVDLNGAITGTRAYDAFGNDQRPRAGNSANQETEFGFAGEQRDLLSNLVFLRARYYDARTGRFITRDALEQSGPGTQGFHRYSYVGNRSTVLTDPTGNCPICVIALAVWAVAEIGLTVADVVSTAQTVLDPCSTTQDKVASVGLLAIGLALPLGGGSTALRMGTKFDAGIPAARRLLPFRDPERLVEVNRTLDRIERGGPFPYARDGKVWENNGTPLPARTYGYYREYTVVTPGSARPGARRVVQGAGGETYYTDDHYRTFVQIDPRRH